jgi:hypothetical protein
MSIEKEFIPYTEALALKELGFDEPCFGYYDEGGNLYTEMVEVLKAPLYQQAFRWFREKYNIHAEITWSPSYEYNPGEWSDAIYEITFVDVSYTKEWKAESPDMQRSKGKQLTYKEAENACLDKLIEICKTKINE